MVEFAELAEDSPVVSLWNCIIHQVFGWPGYLIANLTGQEYGGAKGAKLSHFYFGEDSVFYKKAELGLIMLSDVGVLAMIAGLVWAGQVWGSWNVIVLWGVPWLWVNNWIGEFVLFSSFFPPMSSISVFLLVVLRFFSRFVASSCPLVFCLLASPITSISPSFSSCKLEIWREYDIEKSEKQESEKPRNQEHKRCQNEEKQNDLQTA